MTTETTPGQQDAGPGAETSAAAKGTSTDRSAGPASLRVARRTGHEDTSGRDRAGEGTDQWWRSTAMQAVRAIAGTGREFQCYDLVADYGVPEPDHANRWGALLNHAARLGLIVPVGAAPSRRPATAGSLTRTWRGAPRPPDPRAPTDDAGGGAS